MGAFRKFFEYIWHTFVELPILKIVDAIGIDTKERRKAIAIGDIKDAPNVRRLDYYFGLLTDEVKNDKQVKSVYESKKEELKRAGLEGDADLALGYLGRQMANAVYWIRDNALPKVEDWLDTFAESYNVRADEIDAMKNLARSGEFGLNAVVSFMLGVTLYPAIMTSAEPVWEKVRQEAYAKLPVTLLDAGALIRLYYKDKNNRDVYMEQLKKLGYSKEQIEHLKKDYEVIPATQDFIRFGVRDTYKEDVVKKYGYDEDYPKEIDKDLKKINMSPYWMKHYWRSHWELPSVRQGFRMFHYGLITEDELKDLLRIGDIPSYWRDKLIGISYYPYTRVDVRRVLREGLINEDEFVKNMRKEGYTEDMAKKLLEWTKKAYIGKEKNLTKAQILKAYKYRRKTKDETISLLKELGYDDKQAEFLVNLEDYKLKEEEREDKINTFKAEYANGNITEEELKGKLDEMDLSEYEKEKVVNKAKRLKRKRVKPITKTDLEKMLKAGIMDEKEYKDRMTMLGFDEKDVDMFIELIKKEKEGKG